MSEHKSGFSFNLTYIRENNPELWEKHKLMLAFVDDDVEKIHLNELVDIVGSKATYALLMDMTPQPMKDRMAGKIRKKNI